MAGWVATIRQLRFPKEFRIGAPSWPSDLSGALGAIGGPSPAQPRPLETAPSGENVELLTALATRLWRLKQKMVKPGTDEPLEDVRRTYRHLESAWELLRDAGIEIQDHTNERVPDHGVYSVNQIAFQPVPGLEFDTVIETVKPSVYYKGQQVQMGEVIVGTPNDHQTR